MTKKYQKDEKAKSEEMRTQCAPEIRPEKSTASK
jgi:hypothetical protein